MQGFYFFVKSGFVLIYYRLIVKKYSSILLRKYMIHYLHFAFEKNGPSEVLKDFSAENLETTAKSIYLMLLIIGIVF